MPYTQNQNLLNDVQEVQNTLASLEQHVAEVTDNPVPEYLTEYLQNLQDHLNRTLDHFKADIGPGALRTYKQNLPEEHPKEEMKAHLPIPHNPEDLIPWILARQEHTREWCEQIAETSESEKTSELFTSIADHIGEQNRKLAAETRSTVQEHLHQ